MAGPLKNTDIKLVRDAKNTITFEPVNKEAEDSMNMQKF